MTASPAAILTGAARTDTGRRRPANEDWCGAAGPWPVGSGAATRAAWAVADGVSGHGTGAEAARLVVEEALASLRRSVAGPEAALREAFERANGLLLARGGRGRGAAPRLTTLVVLLVEGDAAWIAHAGDSRAYLVRDGAARPLTRDHTWVAEQVAAGALRPEEAASHPRRNVLTRCLGQAPRVAPEVARHALAEGDAVVLCSDGLTRHVSDAEIGRLADAHAPESAADALIALANERGGTDNVTVVVVRREPAVRPAGGDRPSGAGGPGAAEGEAGRAAAPSSTRAGGGNPASIHERIWRSVSSGILTLDRDGTVTSLNPAAAAMLAVPADRAVGRPLAALLPGAMLAALGPLFAGAELGATVHGTDMQGELPGRGVVALRHRLSPLRDEDGGLVGYVLVLDDETERVRLERARREAERERERVLATFERVVAPAVFEELLRRGPDASGVGGEQRDLTVLFADVRGFTSLAERRPPTEVVRLLNGYLTAATEVVFAHDGTVDKFIGDAIMALFGAPVRATDHPLLAVRAALAMQEAFGSLAGVAGQPVSIGVGVNSGQGVVGTIGAPRLVSYTAIGDVVNVAARLQADARAGEVLVGEETYRRVAEHVVAESLGAVHVKGRAAPLTAYKVLRLRD